MHDVFIFLFGFLLGGGVICFDHWLTRRRAGAKPPEEITEQVEECGICGFMSLHGDLRHHYHDCPLSNRTGK